MIADTSLVDPDVRAIGCGTDVEEGAGAWFEIGREVTLIPDDALIIEEWGTWLFQSPGTMMVGADEKSYSSLWGPLPKLG